MTTHLWKQNKNLFLFSQSLPILIPFSGMGPRVPAKIRWAPSHLKKSLEIKLALSRGDFCMMSPWWCTKVCVPTGTGWTRLLNTQDPADAFDSSPFLRPEVMSFAFNGPQPLRSHTPPLPATFAPASAAQVKSQCCLAQP